MCGHQKHRRRPLCLYVFEAISPHSVASFSFFLLPFILWYRCSSVRLVHIYIYLAGWLRVFVCVSVGVGVCVYSLGHGGVWLLYGVHVLGAQVGYASRRAMLQQLHGVTMYSHDEHHTSAPYCWSERGKGASATKPSTDVVLLILRPSVRLSVRQSVLWSLKTCPEPAALVLMCRRWVMAYL